MYYPFFLTYIITGLIIGLTVFLWALRSGQFADQERARFLALEEDNQGVLNDPAKGKPELYFIFFLIVAGILGSFALVAYALLSR